MYNLICNYVGRRFICYIETCDTYKSVKWPIDMTCDMSFTFLSFNKKKKGKIVVGSLAPWFISENFISENKKWVGAFWKT